MTGPATRTLPRPLILTRDPLRPPSSDSPRVGVVMSLLAHAALIAALALGVRWRTEEPAGVVAELWAATPQMAAPRADSMPTPPPDPAPTPKPAATKPAPTPPPETSERDAQIAIEKAARERKDKERRDAEEERARLQREQAERDRKAKQETDRQAQLKAEQQKRDKADEARKQAQADKAADAQRDKLRQEQMRRMNEQLGGGTGSAGSTGTAARDAGPSASYGGRIKARVKPNIVLTDEVPGNPMAEVEVRVAPDGNIISRRILTSSGVKAWDEAVLRAIDRTAVLPRDTDGRVPPILVISFRPQE